MRVLRYGVSALLLLATPARADESGKGLVAEGLQLRRDHRDQEALDAFRRAYNLEPSPRTRAQIALAEEALEQWSTAEKDLADALASDGDRWIREHADLLQEELVSIRRHLGTLTIEANVAGAELWIEGSRVGTLPMQPVRVAAGVVHAEVRRANRETVELTLTIQPGAEVHQSVECPESNVSGAKPMPIVEAGPSTAATPDTVPSTGSIVSSRAPAKPEEAPPSLPGSSVRRTVAWGALIGAGALLAGGVAAHVAREENVARYNDDALCLQPGFSRYQKCGNFRSTADTDSRLAVAAYAGAGALGLVSAILFYSNPRTNARSTRILIGADGEGIHGTWCGQF